MTRFWYTKRATLGNQRRLTFLELLIIIGLIVLAAVAIAPSMTQAGSLTDQVSHEQCTVLKVDAEAGSVKCVEDQRWKTVKKADLVVGVGDIIRIDRQRLILLRTAAEEIAGNER